MSLSVKDASGATVSLETGAGDGGATPYRSPVSATVGATNDSAATTDTGTFSLTSLVKRMLGTYLGQLLGVASGAADSGNPVKVGAVYNAVQPSVDDGDRVNLQADVNGNLKMALATRLDVANDAVAALVVTGKLSDGAGGTLTVKTKFFNVGSSGANAVVTAVTAKKIRVLSYSLQARAANSASVTASFVDTAGTPIQLSQVWDLSAASGVSKPASPGNFYFESGSGLGLQLNLSAAQTVAGEISYVEV